MPDEVVNFLNNFNLGSAIQFLVVWIVFLVAIVRAVTKIMQEIKKEGGTEAEKRLRNEERDKTEEDYRKKTDKLLEDFNKLSTDTLNKMRDVTSDIDELEERINKIRDDVNTIESKLVILTDSDIGIHRYNIMAIYEKCVKKDKSIDLTTLQSIESLYKVYLAELGDGGDEFIAKLVSEIRNLPTKKE